MNATHIVLTTINDGAILLDLAANAAHYGRKATVWVIADRKTSTECYQNSQEARKLGLDMHYLTPQDQDEAMRKFPEFYLRLPWNSDARRNVGYLLAYEAGCERLIIMDDDNYPHEDDFIGSHEIVGKEYVGMMTNNGDGYYNYLRQAEYQSALPPYPRGYPYFARGILNRTDINDGMVGINIGVWLGDPDIDAMTWILDPFQVDDWIRLPGMLARNTWTPINSQNTCFIRDLIPAAMFVPQRYAGIEFMDRFGDIFAGYFMQAVNEDYLTHIGAPIVIHRRNSHNHITDLFLEAPGIAILEYLLPLLKNFRGDGLAVIDRYLELAGFLAKTSRDLPNNLPPQAGDWLMETARTMIGYAKACQMIEGAHQEVRP